MSSERKMIHVFVTRPPPPAAIVAFRWHPLAPKPIGSPGLESAVSRVSDHIAIGHDATTMHTLQIFRWRWVLWIAFTSKPPAPNADNNRFHLDLLFAITSKICISVRQGASARPRPDSGTTSPTACKMPTPIARDRRSAGTRTHSRGNRRKSDRAPA